MAKPLNDSALIKTISSSKTPLTADQIATSMKTLRHKVVPLLRGLVSSAQIVEVPATSEFPVRFSYRQSADGAQDQSDGKVVQIASSRRKDDEAPAKQAPAKPAEKPVAKKPGRPSLKSVGDTSKTAEVAIGGKKPAAAKSQASADKASVAPKSDKPASAPASAPLASSTAVSQQNEEPMYNRVLRMLGQEPTTREEILMEFGPIGLLIDEMTEKGVIESTYLIDSHVFDLTEAGQLELENLPPVTQASAPEPVAPNVAETSVVAASNEPLVVQPVQKAQEPAEPAQVAPQTEATPARVADEQVALELPEQAASVPAQAPAAKTEEQPSAAKDQDLPENPIMVEMALLMEKLVNDRMGALTKKVEQGDRDRATLVKVGASIKKATAALQLALDALNEIGDSIS